MATYQELRGAFNDADFRNRIEVGITDVAYQSLVEDPLTTNHAERVRYAFRAIENTSREGDRMLKALLVKNKALDVQQILNASDSAIETQVAELWDVFALEYGAAL